MTVKVAFLYQVEGKEDREVKEMELEIVPRVDEFVLLELAPARQWKVTRVVHILTEGVPFVAVDLHDATGERSMGH